MQIKLLDIPSMIVPFTISKSPPPEEESDILGFISRYDHDYASLMADQTRNGEIDWQMVEIRGSYYVLSPDIPEDKVKNFIFELIQKPWCSHIFDPRNTNALPLFHGTRDDGATLSKRLLDFMCRATGYDERLQERHFKTSTEAARAIRPYVPLP